MEKLALYGGTPAKTTPYGTGRRFGKEELANLEEALNQNTLFYWHGNMTKRFCQKFAEMYDSKYCVATSSGTASIHVALGAVGVGPGDEVITAPITDMGSVIGILYQNAIPVFADLDPHTYNMDPKSIEEKITDRTKAIVVVHLAGNSAEMDEIMRIAKKHNVYVIEDCAQSYCCTYKGKYAGTYGDIGCFSVNDFKHISAGDGGMIITNNEELYQKALMFADKNYNRLGAEIAKNVPYLAPNYRMNELTAAVGLAQLDRVEDICAKRQVYGAGLNAALQDLEGIYPHKVLDDCGCSFWFYMFRVDEEELGTTRSEFVKALRAEGIPAIEGYIPQCVYQLDMFKNKTVYPGGTQYPLDGTHGREIEYKDGDCPVAEKILATSVRVPVSEFYTEQDLEETINAIKKVCAYYRNKQERYTRMKGNKTGAYRVEKDSLGTKDVPGDVYYGVQMLRAAENFQITGLTLHPEIIDSLAYIKKAAAIAKKALKTGESVRNLILNEGLLTEETLDKILDPVNMTEPGISGKELLMEEK